MLLQTKSKKSYFIKTLPLPIGLYQATQAGREVEFTYKGKKYILYADNSIRGIVNVIVEITSGDYATIHKINN